MDDQNQQNPQTGGAQPVGDNSLPWMNFSPEAPAAGGAAQGGGTGATDPAATAATSGASSTFDPFGNPFAADNTDSVAAAFAPSPTDGSMAATPAPVEPAPFVPSEETAFTPTPEAAPAEAALPWATHEEITGGSSASGTSTEGDSLQILGTLKTKFDEEEEEFNRQVEEHNANIQYEKEAISKLRSERSDRLAQMRDVVRGLEEMLAIKKDKAPEQRSNERPRHEQQERSNDRGRTSDTRKAERILSKKPQQNDSGINDFLAA